MAGYQDFANRLAVAAGDAVNPTTQITNQFTGVQDEFELRDGDGWLDGRVSGLAVTSNNTSSLTVAAGRGYGGGKEYVGGESLTITGYPAGTYSLYADCSDETTPLKATTTSLTSPQWCLAKFTWDGLGTASTSIGLTTSAQTIGVVPCELPLVTFLGQVATTSYFPPIPIMRDIWVERVDAVVRANNGTSGVIRVDCSIGSDGSAGTSVFNDQTQRPSIAAAAAGGAAYTIAQSGMPDGTRTATAGQHITVAVDEVFGVGTASDLSVWVHGRYV